VIINTIRFLKEEEKAFARPKPAMEVANKNGITTSWSRLIALAAYHGAMYHNNIKSTWKWDTFIWFD